ncbi:MAG: dienelactone hydrolase family protein [Anaerolineae bacterium]|nr:dienelactone hydrolase family protein [Anaerolineae bacterium]
MIVHTTEALTTRDGYIPVTLHTNRGDIQFRYFPVPGAQRAAIWVGGAGGGWDTPVQGLYPRLCHDLMREGITSLWGRYRQANVLNECVLDVLAGLLYLEQQTIETVALTGHSFGGAVVIQAAARSPLVRTVVTLATQSYGVGPVAQFGKDVSLLLIHGTADRVLPTECSQFTYRSAHEPKEIILYEGASHGLDEAAAAVYQTVRRWIIERLTDERVQSHEP